MYLLSSPLIFTPVFRIIPWMGGPLTQDLLHSIYPLASCPLLHALPVPTTLYVSHSSWSNSSSMVVYVPGLLLPPPWIPWFAPTAPLVQCYPYRYLKYHVCHYCEWRTFWVNQNLSSPWGLHYLALPVNKFSSTAQCRWHCTVLNI